ncbi:hypothetical protein COX97_02605 [Candidatus Pacearchaeota archaeon CG_4_10_14_0_2_um_filter_05_32_18]|nr:MAG: hypothetical protein COX97_02605 [Candidatus Pacearchaeota archaeon CG_4_10_14_0_2_um_filter_05_32_18]
MSSISIINSIKNNRMVKKRGLSFKNLLKNNILSLIIFIGILLIGVVIAGNVSVQNGKVSIDDDLTVYNNKLFVDVSEGRVGIGTSTPSELLNVYGTGGSGGASILINSTGGSPYTRGSLQIINSGGNVAGRGIGIFTFNNNETANATWFIGNPRDFSAPYSDAFIIGRKGGSSMDFSSSERGASSLMHLSSEGDLSIGTTGGGARLTLYKNTNGTILKLQDSDGLCNHNPESSSEIVSCSSDVSLKENIVNVNKKALWDKYNGLVVREYNIISSGDKAIGVIAQEVAQTNPELVTSEKVSIYEEVYSENYGSAVLEKTGENEILLVEQPNPWELVGLIQDLKAENEELKTELCLKDSSYSFC